VSGAIGNVGKQLALGLLLDPGIEHPHKSERNSQRSDTELNTHAALLSESNNAMPSSRLACCERLAT